MDHIKIDPYSHIRPNSKISSFSKIGNFVEIKNSQLEEESKVNHLVILVILLLEDLQILEQVLLQV